MELKKREQKLCLESLLAKRKDVLIRFLSARDIRLVISLSSSEYWSKNRALIVEGLRWAPSASFSQVLLSFGVTSVARSLASNRNWTTRTGCRRCLWPGALEAISLSPCRVPYNPPMPPVTQRTFCSNSLFSWRIFCKQSFCHLHYLNSSNYSTRMIGFSHKTSETSLLNVSASFRGKLCKYSRKLERN